MRDGLYSTHDLQVYTYDVQERSKKKFRKEVDLHRYIGIKAVNHYFSRLGAGG